MTTKRCAPQHAISQNGNEVPTHTEVSFTIDGDKIERVAQFRYLGRILDENDDDTHASSRQLARARTKWNRIGRVLRDETQSDGAIVQAILLYGSETWVVLDAHLRQFRSFHLRVGRHLTGRHIRLLEEGSWHWFCPPTAEVLEDAGYRLSMSTSIAGDRQYGVLQGIDCFMRLVDNQWLC